MIVRRTFLSAALMGILLCPGFASDEASEKPAVLWTAPSQIGTRDLFYGQGGQGHAPTATPFVFVEEDRDGHSPKFVVKDRDGVLWKVKVGAEAQPEVVVTRFVWAVGYTTDEDYFLAAQQVENMPPKLSRGGEYVSSDGVVLNARWERMDRKKKGDWKWKDNPFSNTRELNGLRVLMALFNNYDMKDSQNAVYEDASERQFVIADLGATLGQTGSRWPGKTIRGDMEHFGKTKFVSKITEDYVNFAAPSWPMMYGIVPLPPLPYNYLSAPVVLFGRQPAPNITAQRWIGKHVPRKDVAWMAGLLRQLTPAQIQDAFRAGGYSADEVAEFSRIIQSRLAELDTIEP
jgi:hypothetical protein